MRYAVTSFPHKDIAEEGPPLTAALCRFSREDERYWQHDLPRDHGVDGVLLGGPEAEGSILDDVTGFTFCAISASTPENARREQGPSRQPERLWPLWPPPQARHLRPETEGRLVSFPFEWLTRKHKLEAIYQTQLTILAKQEILMAREQELEALVAENSVAINTLSTEVGELKASGNAMSERWAALSAAQTAAIEALTAEVEVARAGAVSDEKAAELKATTDAAVAAAAAAKAASDEATAAWDAAAQPAPAPEQ
jgi:hypothetical protein